MKSTQFKFYFQTKSYTVTPAYVASHSFDDTIIIGGDEGGVNKLLGYV